MMIMSGASKIILKPSRTNIVCVGNSLTSGNGSNGVNGDYPTQMSAMPAMGGIVAINAGHSGWSTEQLIANQAADVDARWVAGKTNVLVVWEGINSMSYGDSAIQAAAAMTTYLANILAVHKWQIVLLTCLPKEASGDQSATTNGNAAHEAYNALIMANYKAMGAKKVVDVRASGSPFNTSSYVLATMDAEIAASGLWAGESAGYHVHLGDAGYLVIAQWVAAAIATLRLR